MTAPVGAWGTRVPPLAALAAAVCLMFLTNGTTDAQSADATDVDVRVWQRVTEDSRLAVSVRPEGRTWADLGTIPLDMGGETSNGRWRYGDVATAGVEVRVWQRVTNYRSLFISARPAGGSWADLGTIPLDMSGETSNGRWRYGDITLAVPPPPPDEVVMVSGGSIHTCALRESGRLICWGDNRYGQVDVPEGRYLEVSARSSHTCALRESGEAVCWGSNLLGEADAPAGTFTSVDAGVGHTCAVAQSGELQCWGWNSDGQAAPPSGTFVSVTTGYLFSCGLRESGQVACWGENSDGQTNAPSESFRSIDSGSSHTCGVLTSGRVTCWGARGRSGALNAPSGSYKSAVAAATFSCALRESGAVRCWGSKPEAPTGASARYRQPPAMSAAFGSRARLSVGPRRAAATAPPKLPRGHSPP